MQASVLRQDRRGSQGQTQVIGTPAARPSLRQVSRNHRAVKGMRGRHGRLPRRRGADVGLKRRIVLAQVMQRRLRDAKASADTVPAQGSHHPFAVGALVFPMRLRAPGECAAYRGIVMPERYLMAVTPNDAHAVAPGPNRDCHLGRAARGNYRCPIENGKSLYHLHHVRITPPEHSAVSAAPTPAVV